ncbi:hypothetical protein O9993_13805 [Vibrio lentus]|nr:hypothetical protein [Vibrio lentus]
MCHQAAAVVTKSFALLEQVTDGDCSPSTDLIIYDAGVGYSSR